MTAPAPASRHWRAVAPLLSVLALLAVLGVGSTVATVIAARSSIAASQADVLANRDATLENRRITERIELLIELEAQRERDGRSRNEELHACIVDLALELANPLRNRTVPIDNPCPAEVAHTPGG